MKKSLVVVLIVLVIVVLIISAFILAVPGTTCKLRGGRIVNTLGGEACGADEVNKGVVKGFKCPCVCCIPEK